MSSHFFQRTCSLGKCGGALVSPLFRKEMVPRCTPAFIYYPSRGRTFAKCTATELKKGSIFSEGGVYYEVESWEVQRQGRGATTYCMDVKPLLGGKRTKKRMGTTGQVTAHTIKSDEKLFMYVDRKTDSLIVADEEFNEESIPLKVVDRGLISNAEEWAGKPVLIRRDESDNIVQVKTARVSEAKLAAYGADDK